VFCLRYDADDEDEDDSTHPDSGDAYDIPDPDGLDPTFCKLPLALECTIGSFETKGTPLLWDTLS
jgi:hypothetical protein